MGGPSDSPRPARETTMRPKALVFLAIVLAFASNGLAQSSAYEVAHPGSAPYSPDRGTPTAAAYQGDQTYCPPDNNCFSQNRLMMCRRLISTAHRACVWKQFSIDLLRFKRRPFGR